MSASVKAYFALKMIGDSIDRRTWRVREKRFFRAVARQEQRFHAHPARVVGADAVERRAGGAGRSHAAAALVPVPSRQGELLGAHRDRLRMMVLAALRPKPVNRRQIGVAELFVVPPIRCATGRRARLGKEPWTTLFGALDKVLHVVEPYFPKGLRKEAIAQAEAFTIERLTVSRPRRDLSGHAQQSADVRRAGLSEGPSGREDARASIDKLLVIKQEEAYCQPCLSPVWDTVLTCQTLLEVGSERAAPKQCAFALAGTVAGP